MGTRATTRICNDTDYIQTYTRWDGFEEDIKWDLENLISNWRSSLDYFKKKLENEPKGVLNMSKWVSDFENLLDEASKNPSIDLYTLLFCIKSFNHHHPLTICDDDINLGDDVPDFIMKYDGFGNNTFINTEDNDCNEILNVEIKAKDISSEYRVMRIYMADSNGELNKKAYTDLKYRNISEKEIFDHFINMPLFWRDFYNVGKEKKDILLSERPNDLGNNNIFRLLRKISYFYKGTDQYSAFKNREPIKVDDESRLIRTQEICEDIIALIPFDMYANVFGTHLALSLPGKVMPLTKAESISEYEISLEFCIIDERASYIFCNIPSLSDEEMKLLYNESFSLMMARETRFLALNNLTSVFPEMHQYELNTNPRFKGGDYEYSIVRFMETQTILELNEEKEP